MIRAFDIHIAQGRVSGNFVLPMFLLVLQMVMEWKNKHLHEFVSPDQKDMLILTVMSHGRMSWMSWMRSCTSCLTSPVMGATGGWNSMSLALIQCIRLCWRLWLWLNPSRRLWTFQVSCGPDSIELLENFSDLASVGHDEAIDILARLSVPKRSMAIWILVPGTRSAQKMTCIILSCCILQWHLLQ